MTPDESHRVLLGRVFAKVEVSILRGGASIQFQVNPYVMQSRINRE